MVAERYLTMLDLIQADAVAKGLSTKAQPVSGGPPRGQQSAAQRCDDVPPPDVTSLNSCFNALFSESAGSEVHACALAELWLKLKSCCPALQLVSSSVLPLLSLAAHARLCCHRMYNGTLALLKAFLEEQLTWKASRTDSAELRALLLNGDLLRFLQAFVTRSRADAEGSHVETGSVGGFLSVLRSAVDSYHDSQLLPLLHNLMLKVLLALGSHW